MKSTPQELAIEPSGFFVFRTPLLPFDEIEAWSKGLEAGAAVDDPQRLSAAIAADRARLRRRLFSLIERPDLCEALFVASPALVDGLAAWQRDPDSKKGSRAEAALVRYLQRMCTRPTPFGLFSGCTFGYLGSILRLDLVERGAYQRHTRLDMDYLFALCEDLGRDADLREQLRYFPNSSLYRTAGRLRYAEARVVERRRSYHLVAVDTSEYLDEILARAASGATVAELVRLLVEGDEDGDITATEAREFLDELIDCQLLVSRLTPAVTGLESIDDLIEQLSAAPPDHLAGRSARQLSVARAALADLDAGGLGHDPEAYRQIARGLETLPTEVELPRLFQVDLIKPAAQASLAPGVLQEVENALQLLQRLHGQLGENALTTFRQQLTERYGEGQEVPLTEALDEEQGVGFGSAQSREASPLLQGLDLSPPASQRDLPWGEHQSLLLRKLTQALAAGDAEIEIDAADLPEPSGDLPPLPDAFQVVLTLAASSAEAVDRGNFKMLFRGASGPSGARLLGRFCHADATLRQAVDEHLRGEEALAPDAVFAEVVHLPEGRLGNILSRPVLRPWEISFLGRGGASRDQQIPISDLTVAVVGGRIVLRSRRLGRQIEPRLSSAHNYSTRSLGIYRFLCHLQAQGVREGLAWSWGAFDEATFLPRVVSGRLVLSRARWRVSEKEIRHLTEASDGERFRRTRAWRNERRLPRRALLVDADNELLVDFDNIASLDAFLALAGRRPQLLLSELFPGPDELCASGPEGRFAHEIVLPYLRRREPRREPKQQPSSVSVQRVFAPGSEWLYAKLYTGTATADLVLRDAVAPVARQALAEGAADRWFFIRYGDSAWHLRLRFHGDPERLRTQVQPRLEAAILPLIADRRVWRFQLGTYERELERYGGDAGIDLAEKLFHIDSEAVVALIEQLEGDEGAAARWRLACLGSDRLLDDLGFDDLEKLQVLSRMQRSFAQEFQVDARRRKQLADKLRAHSHELEQLLGPYPGADHPLAPGFDIFARRSHDLTPIIAELRARQQAGELTHTLAELAPSYVHMFNNRLIRSDARAHEMVIYDALHRLHRSRQARRRQRPPRA